jgi:hypothetical protein
VTELRLRYRASTGRWFAQGGALKPIWVGPFPSASQAFAIARWSQRERNAQGITDAEWHRPLSSNPMMTRYLTA